MSSCWLCEDDQVSSCKDCGLVSSCDDGHLSVHQNQDQCRPFVVKRNDNVGRYMVASRDIEPLETILIESPFCLGPCRDGHLVCVECLTVLQDVSDTCPHCDLPLCGHEDCRHVRNHHLECDYIQRNQWTWRKYPEKLHSLLEALTTIRMMLTKRKLRSKPNGFIPALFDLSLGNGDIPEVDEKVTDESKAVLQCDFDANEFQLCYDQLFINGKSLSDRPSINGPGADVRGTGLYLMFSIMNHSCLANTLAVVNIQGEIMVRAQRKILAGEEITARYGGLNLGQPRRSQLLFDHWRFSCSCARCGDPTELGTYNSAIVCQVSECSGYLTPYRVLLWKCQQCEDTQPLELVFKVIRDAETFIKNNIGCDVDCDVLERTIWTLEHSLHSRHFLLAQIKLVLLTKYSFVSPMTMPMMERVVQLGEELVMLSITLDSVYSTVLRSVVKILLPAWSRLTDTHRANGGLSPRQLMFRKQKTYHYVDMLIKCSKRKKFSS